MNKTRLRKIKKHILEEPRRLAMRQLIQRDRPGTKIIADYGLEQTVPKCGTVACIAGWAQTLWPKDSQKGVFVAQKTLGLETWQCEVLFFDYQWPEPFRSQYHDARTPKERAKIAAARIDHMIETGE